MIGARKKTSVTYKKGHRRNTPRVHSSGREKLTVTDHDKKPTILLIIGSVTKDPSPFLGGFTPLGSTR
jgi:hypothetical protein